MPSHTVILFLLLAFFLAEPAQAGCPAYPPEIAGLKVTGCRFYDGAEDAELSAKVRAYFNEHWQGEEAKRRIAETFVQNTGLLVTGIRNGDGADGKEREYFFRTQDKGDCAQFEPHESYIVSLRRTCAMVFFEAPASVVITLADEKDMQQRGLFGGGSFADHATPVARAPAAHVDDAAVLAWAEAAMKDVFAKGMKEGAGNPYPEYFAEEGWKSFAQAQAGSFAPGAVDLQGAIIVQKLTDVIGPDNLWVIEWDCDVPFTRDDGLARRAAHIRLVVRRVADGDEDRWLISEVGFDWKEG